MFSFNNPYGACPTCTGLGPAQGGSRPHHPQQEALHPGRRHHRLRLEQHQGDSISRMYFEALSKKYGFKLTTPVEELPEEVMDVILYGTKGRSSS